MPILRDDEVQINDSTHCKPAHNYGITHAEEGCYKVEEETEEERKPSDYDHNELEWRNIGSGTWARTFKAVSKLPYTTRGGPCASDVHRRIVYDARTNQVIHDCYIDDTPDQELCKVFTSTHCA